MSEIGAASLIILELGVASIKTSEFTFNFWQLCVEWVVGSKQTDFFTDKLFGEILERVIDGWCIVYHS